MTAKEIILISYLFTVISRKEVNESMKWTRFICGQVVQKFSLVCDHVEKHKNEE